MKIIIKNEIRGRIRFCLQKKRYTAEEADTLQFYLLSLPGVTSVKVYERTGSAAVCYTGAREDLVRGILAFSFDKPEYRALVPEHTGRALANQYREKIITEVVSHFACRLFLPKPFRFCRMMIRAAGFMRAGAGCLRRGKLEVPVLDAAAIAVSILRKDYKTASSVMFLLKIGDTLEEWTHKKSVEDLARSMSLADRKCWLVGDRGREILVNVNDVHPGDVIAVHTGTVIPLDGKVVSGEATVNQASLTGEGIPVRKDAGAYVYAGTAIEEGELRIQVEHAKGATRYEKIIRMIEESQKLRTGVESRAESLADRLVPWSLGGTVLTWLLTQNAQKALSILMVDFSCALKLSMPVTVLSAMRECQEHQLTVKGGKYLELLAEADTIVFDKTGTLTRACPSVADVIPFGKNDRDEMLRIAACLEEHFPHSIANAVVAEAARRGLGHEEMHREVQYVVAHGIASLIEGKKAVIGSGHFVFEDEQCRIPEGEEEKFKSISHEYSHLYLAIGGVLAAVICISDPMRPEVPDVIKKLREAGFSNIVMMTGDSRHTAAAIAEKAGVDDFRAEVLPEDKAAYIEEQKAKGHRVIMIGDGVNDSPALSAADVGIAISEGAQLAREIADITVSEDNLYRLVLLKEISNALFRRVSFNYRFVIGYNMGLILLGLFGILPPGVSALLHNTSTLGIGLHSMTNLLPEERTCERISEKRPQSLASA